MSLKQKEFLLNFFQKTVKDEPIRQCILLRKLANEFGNENVPTSGFAESFRGTFFRTSHKYIFIIENGFKRIKDGASVYWVRGDSPKIRHEYNKPDAYIPLLQNTPGERLITLVGTTAQCVSYVTNKPVVMVDYSPLVQSTTELKGVINCDIFKILHTEHDLINLDFEGRLTSGRVRDINKLKAKNIILTHKPDIHTKKHLSDLKYKVLDEITYKSGKHTMLITPLQLK